MNSTFFCALLSMDVYNRPGAEPSLVKLQLPSTALAANKVGDATISTSQNYTTEVATERPLR